MGPVARVRMPEPADRLSCRKCRRDDPPFRRVDAFDRLRLADDPSDPNCGHFYLESVHVMECSSCAHRQEHVHQRTPYPTLRTAQSELDAHLLGKG